MIDGTLYLVGKDKKTGAYVENGNSCSMCKRMIINSGINKVIIRDDRVNYRVVKVNDWIDDDDSLEDRMGY